MSDGSQTVVISWRERIAWLAFGTVLTFALFEVGFRLAEPMLGAGAKAGAEDAQYTVLCDGDSFTYGIGGRSFPNQIEEIMRARHGEGVVRTVNEGLPGLNTALLADRFESNLLEHKPDVALIIVGENNSWNSVRLQDPTGQLTLLERLDQIALYSRAYKFLKVMSVGWRHATFHEAGNPALDPVQQAANYITETREVIGYPDDEPRQDFPKNPASIREPWTEGLKAKSVGDYPKAIELFTSITEQKPEYKAGWFELGVSYMRVGALEQAIEALEQSKTIEPQVPDVYFSLGHAYERHGDIDSAVQTWADGLRIWPKSRKLYRSMAARLYVEQRLWETLDQVADVPGVEDNLLHQYLLRLREKGTDDVNALVSDGMADDVRRVVRMARQHGVSVIFGSYPDAGYPIIEQTAREEGAGYIDFQPAFKDNFPSRDAYLSADRCHCNSEGYALMAEMFSQEVEALLGL